LEKDDEYLVTCQLGSMPDISMATSLFTSTDKDRAWQFYQALRPLSGMAVALWHPDGNLIAFHAGRRSPI
jgi:hypothetical protein